MLALPVLEETDEDVQNSFLTLQQGSVCRFLEGRDAELQEEGRISGR